MSDVMTLEEVAQFLKVGEQTVYELARRGDLPGRKVGREWRFFRPTLVRWFLEGESNVEGKVQTDEWGGEYKVENGRELVALWLPISLEEKRYLLDKAEREGWSLSDKVMGLVRELMV